MRATRIVVALVVVISGMAAMSATASADPAWSIQPSVSPLGPTKGGLAGVSCSGTMCMAVGWSPTNSVSRRPFSQRWDGTAWRVVTTPAPMGTSSELRAVSCPGTTTCVAVGVRSDSGGAHTFIAQWNGSVWSIVADTSTSVRELNSVSCASPTDCVAVGRAFASPRWKPLIEHFDGSGWSAMAAADASGESFNLLGVSCFAATQCTAVGSYSTNGFNSFELIEHWNGTAWSFAVAPSPAADGPSILRSVSCPSASHCFAVGSWTPSGGGPSVLTIGWDGSRWTNLTSSNPIGSGSSHLYGVACVSATTCQSVGRSLDPARMVAEKWDGTKWTPVTPQSAPLGALSAVACRSAADCFAVGDYGGSQSRLAIVEHWNGTAWTLTAPAIPGSQSKLNGIACLSATACVAVGQYETNGSVRTLVERWNGTSWSTVTTPNPVNSWSVLNGVTCLTASDCTAVGSSQVGSVTKTLIEHWNGTSWSIVPSPNPYNTTPNQLFGVDCWAANGCTAVGTAGNQLSVEQWNGSVWTAAAQSSFPSSTDLALFGVDCLSTSECTLVGRGYLSGASRPLIERWTGATWVTMPTPSSVGVLNSVSCASSSDCVAVGTVQNGTHLLTEVWDGANWTIKSAAVPLGSTAESFTGVSCASATDCFAVGQFVNSSGGKMLTEHWNGTSWSVVASPNRPFATQQRLNGVSCPAASSCFAVGGATVPPFDTTLVERFA